MLNLLTWLKVKIIEKSRFWDEAWYREQYLRQEPAQNAVLHYLRQGKLEAADPSPYFSSREYYLENPDVKQAGMNPLVHYVLHGKREGREIIQWKRMVKRFPRDEICYNTQPHSRPESGRQSDIKIFVACKQDSYVPRNPLLFPIQTGAAMAEKRFENMLHDDTGENISDKNDYYCELTAQYWAWKNVDADYYGFFHNRRYMSFSRRKFKNDDWGFVNFDSIDQRAVERFELIEEPMRELIEQYDMIVAAPLDITSMTYLGVDRTPFSQYALGSQHFLSDLKTAIKILKARHPEFSAASDSYFSGSKAFFYNMYILKKSFFFAYCEWLFPILKDLHEVLDYTGRSEYAKRAVGFVAERLFGVYLTHVVTRNADIRIHFAQFCLFTDVTPVGSSTGNIKRPIIQGNMYYYLWGVFPILKKTIAPQKVKYYLFNFILLLKVKVYNKKYKYYLGGFLLLFQKNKQ